MWLENMGNLSWVLVAVTISGHVQPGGILIHSSLGMSSENDDFWAPNPIQEYLHFFTAPLQSSIDAIEVKKKSREINHRILWILCEGIPCD